MVETEDVAVSNIKVELAHIENKSETPGLEPVKVIDIVDNDGYAHIKKEFIVTVERKENYDHSSINMVEDTDEPPSKKLKKKGRNYSRPKLQKTPRQFKLCRAYWNLKPGEVPVSTRCEFPNCSFLHDVEKYLNEKPKDLDEICQSFEKYGFCPYGLICRFGSNHIQDMGSKVDEEKQKISLENPSVINILKKEVQFLLRKRKYDFSIAEEAIKIAKCTTAHHQEINKNVLVTETENVNRSTSPYIAKLEMNNANCHGSRLGPASDEDLIKIRSAEKKKVIDWRNKLYVAPLTTLGNLPFRRICKRLGADITCSEMAVATCLLQGSGSEWALVKRHNSEDCFGVQLCGGSVDAVIKCSHLLEKEIAMDFIDINMGCPIDLIFRQGAGSALMRRAGTVRQMVVGMNNVLSCPVTLKMRTGVYKDSKVAASFIDQAKLWDVNMVALHGRSKEQRFLRTADWNYIQECAAISDPMPLFGNGDILTYDDYIRQKEFSNVTGIMLGRGALIKPWLLTEIKEERVWDISSSERFEILKEFTNYGMEHWGSDDEGMEKTRRFLLEWLSFLYRYIPVGILEQPQKMNQKPPIYIGRNDLETLMASKHVKDWVKISEMLLGKVPDNFVFLPKHKANSWDVV